MTGTTPVAELLFGEADATPMSTDPAMVKRWDDASESVARAPKAWLTTVRADGRPHGAPVLVAWADGTPWIATRPGSRKARNLDANGRGVLMVADETIDLVIEGMASRTHDETELHKVAGAFLAKTGWKFSIRDGTAYDEALPGPPDYGFYRIVPVLAFGYGPDGLTATRWSFPASGSAAPTSTT